MRIFEARIAPASASLAEAIRHVLDVDRGKLQESFAHDAFRSYTDVPIVLSHRESFVVGRTIVGTVSGGWHHLDFTLDERYWDLARVGTAISISFIPAPYHVETPFGRVRRYTRAKLTEMSLLGPGELPAYPGACVTGILRAKATPKPSSGDEDGEFFEGLTPLAGVGARSGRNSPILVRNCGQILGLR